MMLITTQTPEIDLPGGKSGPAYIDAAIEGLTRLNVVVMKHMTIPPLYKTGIRWRLESGPQRWRRCDEMIREGKTADCKNLAAYRAAELRVSGEDPTAEVLVYHSGEHVYHAVVGRDKRSWIEDPSRILGMPTHGHAIPTVRQVMEYTRSEYIGEDPVDSLEMTITSEPTQAGGHRVTIRVPLVDIDQAVQRYRALFVTREAPTKQSATKKALSDVSNILKNPAVSALIPGPAKFALQVAGSQKARDIAKSLLKLF